MATRARRGSSRRRPVTNVNADAAVRLPYKEYELEVHVAQGSMAGVPPAVAAFLAGRPVVVAGVSRTANAPANAIFRRLRDSGREPVPLNPHATELEGARCYPDLESVPGPIHALMVVTHPKDATTVVRAALARGVRHVWFHRSFGDGSVSDEAVALCRSHGVEPIVGGCPLMYCPPVDSGHRFFRWWLRRRQRVPG